MLPFRVKLRQMEKTIVGLMLATPAYKVRLNSTTQMLITIWHCLPLFVNAIGMVG